MQYCAFLRGVNVKGTNMKMQDVCAVFKEAGMQHVTSVLASGNILFLSDRKKPELKKLLEAAMSQAFGYDAHLFILQAEDCKRIIHSSPFNKNTEMHLYVFLGIPAVEHTLMEAFEKAIPYDNEKAAIRNGYFYWQINKGDTLGSAFSKVLGNKTMKSMFTSRNMQTLEKIVKKFENNNA